MKRFRDTTGQYDGLGAIGAGAGATLAGVAGSPGSAVNLLPPTPKPVRVSRPSQMMQGYLVHRVEPTYPRWQKPRGSRVWFSCRRSSASGDDRKPTGDQWDTLCWFAPDRAVRQ